jgi:FtsP/CotA-like multicopper oxidase with cupredoxin domain
VSSINGKALGAGEPLRVREGKRVLFHILNSSPTEVHWIALAGHELTVVALDGNPVPTARSVSMLRLAPAERVCALVEMNHPGVWVFGEVRQHIQRAGMGIVVEYAGNSGSTQWLQPRALQWNYEQFGTAGPADFDDPTIIEVPLLFEPRFQGHGAMEAWTINGKSYPDTHADPLITGRRYRLRLINRSSDDHPLHLHRHSFELRTLGASLDGRQHGVAVRGVIKDVVQVDAMTQTTVEFLANHPGDTLFHCHQQDHMCMGFMLVFQYA